MEPSKSFMVAALSFFFLLIISWFTYLFSKKVKLPYTVLLFLVWLLLVPLSHLPSLSWISSFELTPDILFFVFLPILVFESAYNIKYKELLKNWFTIFFLAVIWLLISTFWIGFLLYFIFSYIGLNIPLWVTILFWGIISATDPVAVLSLFKSIWAPKRLSLIFEGESLFNDGTSLAVFLIVLTILEKFSTWNWFDLWSSLFEWFFLFLSMVIGWIIFWLFMWFLFSKILWTIKNIQEIEITLTLILAHVTFILSELISDYTEHWGFVHIPISWIIATAVAGLIVWNYWKYKISPKVEQYMDIFWSYSAWLVNSLVFILMGLLLWSININFIPFLPLIFIAIAVVMIVRWISVYVPLWILSKLKIEEPVPLKRQHLLSWWSLRWALALMMVLMIPDDLTLPWWSFSYSIKQFLIVLVVSSVIFTLIIKALTIMPLIKKLKINKISNLEKLEYYEWIVLSFLRILLKLEQNYKKWFLLKEEYEKLKNKYKNKLDETLSEIKNFIKNEKYSKELIKRSISLHALWIEKKYLKDLFTSNEIDENNYKVLLGKILRQKERLENGLHQFRNNNDFSYDKKNIFEKFVDKSFDRGSVENKYIRNRTRLIIIEAVILELEKLKKSDIFPYANYFDEIINMYKKLYDIAKEKNIELLKEHKTSLIKLWTELSEKSLLRVEEWVIKDLFEKEIISSELYRKFMEEIELDMYK